ncbi:MAG TPA: recombinase family protein [Abditibacterium sp.]|jgi:DNA invertase Pin-like site-specific DNA recombinase
MASTPPKPAFTSKTPKPSSTSSTDKGVQRKRRGKAAAKAPASHKGQRIGYVRVSSSDQNPARQLEDPSLDRTFVEFASGKDVARPQLDEMLGFIRDGDTLVVHSMDRLARNLDDLRRLVEQLTSRGVRVEFVKESLAFTGEDSPMSTLLLSVMGAFAEFERALIRERQKEGIALAQRRGDYRGRKKSLTPEQVEELRARIQNGEKKSVLARELGLSRETIYQYLKTQ